LYKERNSKDKGKCGDGIMGIGVKYRSMVERWRYSFGGKEFMRRGQIVVKRYYRLLKMTMVSILLFRKKELIMLILIF